MTEQPNTLFLRLEGPLQAWGDPSKFVVRRTMDAPTKSGVIGMICCAMGFTREHARAHLPRLKCLRMGVRIDRPGVRWWDYHTVGAKVGLLMAQGGIKHTASTKEIEALITRREYLADASFLVALQGEDSLIQEVAKALEMPKWPPYLGRKCCPPSVPVLVRRKREAENGSEGRWEPLIEFHDDLKFALRSQPRRASANNGPDDPPVELACLLEWTATNDAIAPPDAEVWYDVPVSFSPPFHEARFVERQSIAVSLAEPIHQHTPVPPRSRTDYGKDTWGMIRDIRLKEDKHLCVFCKAPLGKYNATVQHVDYRKAGVEDNRSALHDDQIMKERLKHLRSLCRLCHDAVTMIEYGLGMGLDRINPEDACWRDQIIQKRGEIIQFRSLETRRRKLSAEEVE